MNRRVRADGTFGSPADRPCIDQPCAEPRHVLRSGRVLTRCARHFKVVRNLGGARAAGREGKAHRPRVRPATLTLEQVRAMAPPPPKRRASLTDLDAIPDHPMMAMRRFVLDCAYEADQRRRAPALEVQREYDRLASLSAAQRSLLRVPPVPAVLRRA